MLISLTGHPHREAWLARGRAFKQRWHGEDAPPDDEEGYSPHGSCRVQVVRSVSDWSHGVLTEHSIQNACEKSSQIHSSWDDLILLHLDIDMIKEAKHFIYIGACFCFTRLEPAN